VSAPAPKTLYDKLWDAHVVSARDDGTTVLYIDRVILHEVSSAQAFEGLQLTQRPIWRSGSMFAVADHQVPTTDRAKGMAGFTDDTARLQVQTLDDNCDRHGVPQFKLNDLRQGIVHVVGPEQGITLRSEEHTSDSSHNPASRMPSSA
jgi:3-isopropylmalate/(R)-2-methylmalate dehydratase large subunit